MTDFADWIRAETKHRGWSQATLAKRAGFSRSSVTAVLAPITARGDNWPPEAGDAVLSWHRQGFRDAAGGGCGYLGGRAAGERGCG